jgi:tRNA A37 methylthiotransferase MiaB
MNRGYEKEDFLIITDKFRNKFENGVLSTDIIVGHPLETEDMFNNTLEIVKKAKPDIIHIFKFSKRPNTLDEKLKDLPSRIKKDRSRILTNLFHQINQERNNSFIGKKEEVLVIEKRENAYLARNNSGRAVVIKEDGLRLGKPVNVEIIGSEWNYIEGKTIN